MRNSYEITRDELIEPNLYEVRGAAFCAEDIFEFVGKDQLVCTFVFRAGGDSHKTYGRSMVGTVVYSPKQHDALASQRSQANTEESDVLRVRCLQPALSQMALDHLRYRGVPISDVEEISFIPFMRPAKKNAGGTKEVPGVVYVELDGAQHVDVDMLFQNLATLKHNAGTKLIPYERERLIGVMLSMHDGRIDSRILSQFGFTPEQASASVEIAFHTLMTTKRRGVLTDTQVGMLRDLTAIRQIGRIQMLLREIKRSAVSAAALRADAEALTAIQSSIEHFEPHVLLASKNQIYWDLEGYLHIAMGHVKEMQVGSYKGKTPFPYKAADLETLVEQVLRQVEDEIRSHFEASPPYKNFGRHGRMAVFFNGDYFHLKIDAEGRLVQFHAIGERRAG
jgi:hypothetical protein